MDAKEFFHRCIHMADHAAMQVQESDLHKPTPYNKWDVRQLLNHMVYELAQMPDVLQGKTVGEIGGAYDGDLLHQDPTGSWRVRLHDAIGAVDQAPEEAIVHVSAGDIPAEDYIIEASADMVIHGWDLAKALGQEYHIPDDLCGIILGQFKENFMMMRQQSQAVTEVPIPDNADIETKLLALYGRSQQWSV